MTDAHFRQWTVEDADGRMVDVIPVDDYEELVARLQREIDALRRGLDAQAETIAWLEQQLTGTAG